jgi:CRISPR-associated endonuclease/helicase Cas3
MVNENKAYSIGGIPGRSESWDAVKATYRDFMLAAIESKKKVRVPRIVDIKEGPPAKVRLNNAVVQECEAMHKQHDWACGDEGKRVSFGLVRVANISTAIHVAQALAQVEHFRVCCYHSQELRLVRHRKEAALDRLLSRQTSREDPTGSAHIADDPAVADILAQFSGITLAFIVVATPVEEIGRDHDFDWAVIEPSGARAIVQCAGRVNRHRLKEIECPNIAILQYNIRHLKNLDDQKPDRPAFLRPGLETSEQKYKSHDLHELINTDLFAAVDSRLIFDHRHMIVEEETNILEDVLREPLRTVTGEYSNWMARGHYDKYTLRSQEDMPSLNLFYNPDERSFYQIVNGRTAKPEEFYVHPESQSKNDWLSFDQDACENLRQTLGMSFQDAYSVQVRTYDDALVKWYPSLGLCSD